LKVNEFAAEKLNQVDRELGIAPDERQVAVALDQADLRRFQRLAGRQMRRVLLERMRFEQLACRQNVHDVPLAARRGAGQLNLAGRQEVEAQAGMALIEDGRSRAIVKPVRDLLQRREVGCRQIAEDGPGP